MNKGCFGNPVGQTTPEAGAAKAWAVWDGTSGVAGGAPCTIQAGYNVREIIRNGTGDYTVRFLRPFVSNRFACLVSAFGSTNSAAVAAGTGGQSKRVVVTNPTPAAVDAAEVHLVAFGEWA